MAPGWTERRRIRWDPHARRRIQRAATQVMDGAPVHGTVPIVSHRWHVCRSGTTLEPRPGTQNAGMRVCKGASMFSPCDAHTLVRRLGSSHVRANLVPIVSTLWRHMSTSATWILGIAIPRHQCPPFGPRPPFETRGDLWTGTKPCLQYPPFARVQGGRNPFPSPPTPRFPLRVLKSRHGPSFPFFSSPSPCLSNVRNSNIRGSRLGFSLPPPDRIEILPKIPIDSLRS